MGDGRQLQKQYTGKAPATATPEELRALFELRQQRSAEVEDRRRHRDTRSDTGDSRTGSTSGSSGNTSDGGSYKGRDGRSYSSDRNKSDPFSSRRPPPIEEDFEVIGSKRGASFEQARLAYKNAVRKHHPDIPR